MATKTTLTLKQQAAEWARKQKQLPNLIIGHYLAYGQNTWEAMTEEHLKAAIQAEYDKAAKEERENKEKLARGEKGISWCWYAPEFAEALDRGAFELAHMSYELRRQIIKDFL